MSEAIAAGIETALPDGDRPVVVFDGACRFCRRQVERMRRRDRDEVFVYVPRQTEGLTERFPALAEGAFNRGMRLVERDGAVLVGADAVHGIARRLSGWRTLAWLYRVPVLHTLLKAAYGWVARNRERLGGTCDDACATP